MSAINSPYITLDDDVASFLASEEQCKDAAYELVDLSVVKANKREDWARFILKRVSDDTLWENVFYSETLYSEWTIVEPGTNKPAFVSVDSIRPINHYELDGVQY